LPKKIRNKCILCGRLAQEDKSICEEDEITYFFLNDIVNLYLTSNDGIVNSEVADVMKHFASLYLEDPFIQTLRNAGEYVINKFVINPGTDVESIVKELSLKDFKFKANSYISFDMAMKVYQDAQILEFNSDSVKPGKMLIRLINLRGIGTSLRDSQFEQVMNEYWGLIAVSITLQLINMKINGELRRLPRIALGILSIISSVIKKASDKEDRKAQYDRIHRFQIIRALANQTVDKRTKLLNRLLGIGIHRQSYILADFKGATYFLAPEVARFAEYERNNYRTRMVDRYRS